MKYNISEEEAAILRTVEHQADVPVTEFTELLGMRGSTIRYHLNRLRNVGVVKNRTAFVNSYRLGFQAITIYFSVAPGSPDNRVPFLRALCESDHIEWVGELIGEYSFGATVIAQNLSGASDLISEISAKYGDPICAKSALIRLRFVAFGRKYLSDKGVPAMPFVIEHGGVPVVIDDVYHRILSALTRGECPSSRNLGESLNLPASTIRHRLKKLEEQGVVQGYIYRYRLGTFGGIGYRICIQAKGVSRIMSTELYAFAAAHPHIIHYIEYMGEWDYELGIEVRKAAHVNELIGQLHHRFGQLIGTVKVFSMVQHLKYSGYPFHLAPLQMGKPKKSS